MSSLSDIISAWDDAPAAGEHDPLPPGEYDATVIRGELTEHPKTGTPSYKLTFRVEGGPHAGRHFYADLWLTSKAMAYTKRDLLKVGIMSADQLDQPLAARFLCRVNLVRRRSDEGAEFNRVRRFDVLERVDDRPDPFAPAGGVA